MYVYLALYVCILYLRALIDKMIFLMHVLNFKTKIQSVIQALQLL